MTQKQTLVTFIDHLESQKKSPHTLAAYRTDISQFIDYLQKNQLKLPQIKGEHLRNYQTFLKSKSLTPKSITRKINALRSFFRYLTHTKVVSQNPALQLSTTTPTEPTVKILSPLEYRALRDAAGSDPLGKAVIELVLQAGLKPQELINLKTNDFDASKATINIGSRQVPLSPPAVTHLNQYLHSRPTSRHQSLFQNQFKKPLSLRSLNQKVNRIFKSLNLAGSLMNLRHTFIHHQLKAGISPTIIQQITGLKSISSLSKYLDLLKSTPTPTPLKPL